jgi:uncharacterized membrane protein (UPF0127 family)
MKSYFKPLKKVLMKIKNYDFILDLALTDTSQRLGLMFRKSMPKNRGMLFVFPEEQPRSFTMKNCKMDLDILGLDSNGYVVDKQTMYHRTQSDYSIDRPIMYAIELNSGVADTIGINIGDQIRL